MGGREKPVRWRLIEPESNMKERHKKVERKMQEGRDNEGIGFEKQTVKRQQTLIYMNKQRERVNESERGRERDREGGEGERKRASVVCACVSHTSPEVWKVCAGRQTQTGLCCPLLWLLYLGLPPFLAALYSENVRPSFSSLTHIWESSTNPDPIVTHPASHLKPKVISSKI